MDAQDFQLVGELMRHPLAPVAELARTLGLSRNATQARLDRLHRDGLLQGYMARPSPDLFGKTAVLGLFDLHDAPTPEDSELFAVEEVWWYSVNHEDVWAVGWLTERDSPTHPPAGLERVMGVPAQRRFVQNLQPLAEPDRVLSALQWRVVEALVADPRASLAALAERTGLAAKTVGRHRETLVQSGRVEIQPILLDHYVAQGVVFEFWIQGASRGMLAALRRVVPECMAIEEVRHPAGLLVLCRVANMGQALAAQKRISAMDGVTHVEMILGRAFGFAKEKVIGWCADKRAEWAQARRA